MMRRKHYVGPSSAPSWTFGYAIFWGGFTAVVPFISLSEYRSVAIAVGTSLLGIVVIALGIAVCKRKRSAAGALVAFALFDAASRAFQGASRYLMPGLLLVCALTAAIKLGKERSVLGVTT